jgi:Rho termination factor-like protein
MPQKAWSVKRERQYDHIVGEAKDRGMGAKRAKEIAARTVNKERARTGEARESSRLSRTDMPSGRRGGQRANRSGGPRGRTVEQLRNEARSLNIRGRSRMNKAQLVAAINRKKS